jgi:hypothetical protein
MLCDRQHLPTMVLHAQPYCVDCSLTFSRLQLWARADRKSGTGEEEGMRHMHNIVIVPDRKKYYCLLLLSVTLDRIYGDSVLGPTFLRQPIALLYAAKVCRDINSGVRSYSRICWKQNQSDWMHLILESPETWSPLICPTGTGTQRQFP